MNFIKRCAVLIVGCLAILITSGCANKVVVSEVLQMQVDDKLYTKTNIWYTNQDEISCLNIQKGLILPIGTEVEIIKCDENKLKFKSVQDGESFTIIFDRGLRMVTMGEYLKEILTTKPLDVLLEGIDEETQNNIKNAQVVIGMSKDEVELSYGVVPPIQTVDKRNLTWMYPIDDTKYIRLIFRANKLKTILNLYDE